MGVMMKKKTVVSLIVAIIVMLAFVVLIIQNFADSVEQSRSILQSRMYQLSCS